jgi:hypothetical protein
MHIHTHTCTRRCACTPTHSVCCSVLDAAWLRWCRLGGRCVRRRSLAPFANWATSSTRPLTARPCGASRPSSPWSPGSRTRPDTHTHERTKTWVHIHKLRTLTLTFNVRMCVCVCVFVCLCVCVCVRLGLATLGMAGILGFAVYVCRRRSYFFAGWCADMGVPGDAPAASSASSCACFTSSPPFSFKHAPPSRALHRALSSPHSNPASLLYSELHTVPFVYVGHSLFVSLSARISAACVCTRSMNKSVAEPLCARA